MAPTVPAALTYSKEHLVLSNKVNWELDIWKNAFVTFLLASVMWFSRSRLLTDFLFCLCSWESRWWRRCAEIVSTVALSSSSLSLDQHSCSSSQTPSWRKQTSWRWSFSSSNGSSSSQWTAPPAPHLSVRATPGVSKRWKISCPGRKWCRNPKEDSWTISRTDHLPLIWTRSQSLLPQLKSPVRQTSSKEETPVKCTLWRPW